MAEKGKAGKAPKSAVSKKSMISTLYDTSGGLKRKNKFCPRCGPGTFLANHKNRLSCGKCNYVEMKGK